MTKEKKGLPPLKVPLLATEERQRAIIEERVAEEYRRMEALAEQLGIPDSSTRWYHVALELARRHVPELMPAKTDGRKKRWGEFELAILMVEVEFEQATSTPPMPIREATRRVALRSPWKDILRPWEEGLTHSSDPGEALRKQYNIGRNCHLATLHARIATMVRHNGTAESWQEVLAMVTEKS